VHSDFCFNDVSISFFSNVPELQPYDYVWDETACGPKLIIENSGRVVHASNDLFIHQSVTDWALF
ncbi:hypothetical protein GLOIN_2v1790784, partial [Rhizophagus irregularis DAOM 181602=DAOM 197198]